MIHLPKISVTIILIPSTHMDCVHHVLLYSKTVFNRVVVSSSWYPCLLSNNSAVRASTHNVWNSGYFITCQRVSSILVQHNLCGQCSGWVIDLREVYNKHAPRPSLLWSETRQGIYIYFHLHFSGFSVLEDTYLQKNRCLEDCFHLFSKQENTESFFEKMGEILWM